MRIIFTFLLFISLFSEVIAQTNNDSLYIKLQTANGTEKVDVYLAIAKANWRTSTDSIYKFSNKALHLAREIGYLNGEAKALSYIGVTFFYKAEYDSVLMYYDAAIEKFKQSGDNSGAAITINNKGVLYKRQGNYSKAIECYNEALLIQEAMGDEREVGGILLNIGNIYYVQNILDESLKYYFKALEKFESINDKVKIAGALTNIGEVYAEYGKNMEALEYYEKAYELQKETNDVYGIANSLSNIGIINKTINNYDLSEQRLKQSAELYSEMQDQDALAFVYNHLAELYTMMRKWDNALEMFNKTIQIQQAIGDNEGLAYVKLDLAKLYFQKKEWVKATQSLNQSIELAKSLNILDILQKSFLVLSKIDSAQGNYLKSLENYKTYTLYKDTIFNLESDRNIAEMQTRYETSKKEQEIIKLKEEKVLHELKVAKSRIRWIISFSVFIILSVIIFMRYRSRQRKVQARLMLKNTMETEDKDRKYFAEELHDGIGPLLSTIKMYVNELDNEHVNEANKSIIKESNNIIDEVICSARNLSHNLMPQNIESDGLLKSLQVFSKRVCVKGNPKIVIDAGGIGNYGKWQQVMIYRIITELINNSIKHACASEIKIMMKETIKELKVVYQDKGTGFDIEKVLKNSDGIGLQNVISRVKSLNGNVLLHSEAEKGFKAEINLSLKELYDIKLN